MLWLYVLIGLVAVGLVIYFGLSERTLEDKKVEETGEPDRKTTPDQKQKAPLIDEEESIVEKASVLTEEAAEKRSADVEDRCSECAVDYDWFYGVCGLKDQASASPDRAYEWYKTQMGTGPFETNNCGPTSAAMAMVWYERTLDVDPGVVREAITGSMDGWWYTSHIEQALDLYGVPYAILELTSADDARAELDAGHILILCLTMDMISQEVPPYVSHFNRFYGYGSGHFLVVKGYMENGTWLDFYDPNNWTADHYTDGSPYGKDRFYSSSEVVASR